MMECCSAGASTSLSPFSSAPLHDLCAIWHQEKGEEPHIAALSCIFLLIKLRVAVTGPLKLICCLYELGCMHINIISVPQRQIRCVFVGAASWETLEAAQMDGWTILLFLWSKADDTTPCHFICFPLGLCFCCPTSFLSRSAFPAA